jgi:hypothetical protein
MTIRYNAGTYMVVLVWLNIEHPTPISDFRSTVPTSIPACQRQVHHSLFNVHYSKDVPVLKRIIIFVSNPIHRPRWCQVASLHLPRFFEEILKNVNLLVQHSNHLLEDLRRLNQLKDIKPIKDDSNQSGKIINSSTSKLSR